MAEIKWEQGKLDGAPNKVEEIVQFHIGDVVNSLQNASLIPGGGECIIYGTVMGIVGALLPSPLEMMLTSFHTWECI